MRQHNNKYQRIQRSPNASGDLSENLQQIQEIQIKRANKKGKQNRQFAKTVRWI